MKSNLRGSRIGIQVLIGILLFLLSVGSSWAATYYVATNGNDANSGTQAAPFKTIQRCANAAQAGDTCLVYPGKYDERVSFKNSGTAQGKIVFKGVSKEAEVLRGFNTSGQQYIRIEGFSITYLQSGWWQGGGIWLESDNVDIIDNYFHDIPDPGILSSWSGKGSWDNILVSGNKMYKVNAGIFAGGKNWLVENNEVERLYRFDCMEGNPSGTDADYSRFSGDYITFRGNYFHGTRQSEICTSHTDGFQSFDDNGDWARNITIENNIVQGFHEGLIINNGRPGNAENIFVRNNIFDGKFVGGELGPWGITVNNVKNIVVTNNVIANIDYHGAGFGSNSTATLYNNIFYNAGTNYWASTGSSIISGYNILNQRGSSDYPRPPTDRVLVDPLFVNPASLAGPDGLPFTSDDGYRLQSGSPAIDTGTNATTYGVTTDIAGTARPQGSGWDIGAYEYVSGTPPPTQYTLTVAKSGSGTVTSSPSGINCGSSCSASFNSGTNVTLTAPPSSGYVFTGWSGACSGTGTCTVTMNSAQSVTATFNTSSPPGGTTFTINVQEGANAFTITTAGTYLLTGLVRAPSEGANSFYVGIDQDPGTANGKVWDLEVTSVFQEQNVSWRGSCDSTCAQFDPKLFSLSAGSHTLYLKTRESGSEIQTMTFTVSAQPPGDTTPPSPPKNLGTR